MKFWLTPSSNVFYVNIQTSNAIKQDLFQIQVVEISKISNFYSFSNSIIFLNLFHLDPAIFLQNLYEFCKGNSYILMSHFIQNKRSFKQTMIFGSFEVIQVVKHFALWIVYLWISVNKHDRVRFACLLLILFRFGTFRWISFKILNNPHSISLL